jgi:hypothetical protein
MERELVKLGYRLARRERAFNTYHRKEITRYFPEAAGVRTTSGTSSLYTPAGAVRNLFGFPANLSKRVAKQVLRKVTGRTFFQSSPDDPAGFDVVMRIPEINGIEIALHGAGILGRHSRLKDVPKRLLGRFLTVGLLILRLGEVRSDQASAVELDFALRDRRERFAAWRTSERQSHAVNVLPTNGRRSESKRS